MLRALGGNDGTEDAGQLELADVSVLIVTSGAIVLRRI
jgi:hypothetical protein